MATIVKVKGPQGSGKTQIADWLEAGLLQHGKTVVRLPPESMSSQEMAALRSSDPDAEMVIVEEMTHGPRQIIVELVKEDATPPHP